MGKVGPGGARERRRIEAEVAGEDHFWALRDVSFDIQPGEIVGIIGRNGAGKSTLLKILSRITEPTEGEAIIEGRVGSLLEVGTGFHPELTGRENIFMNGTILGMKRAEITAKFDEIVAFAELDQFIDTPVKRYSSGMYVRLAFSVAAHLEPEILLVDEVLAVGDAAFQRKCLGKMGDVAKDGRTVLYVSHNMAAVVTLCGRCVWLRGGQVCMQGTSAETVSSYLCEGQHAEGERTWLPNAPAPGKEGQLRYRAVRIINHQGQPTPYVRTDERFDVEVEYELYEPLGGAWLGITVNTVRGEVVFCTGDADFESGNVPIRTPGVYRARCRVPADLLNEDRYSVGLLGHVPGVAILVDEPSVLTFDVLQTERVAGRGRQPGFVRPALVWDVKRFE
jgi:lipopolysaccharide transport system ATP-binding protein